MTDLSILMPVYNERATLGRRWNGRPRRRGPGRSRRADRRRRRLAGRNPGDTRRRGWPSACGHPPRGATGAREPRCGRRAPRRAAVHRDHGRRPRIRRGRLRAAARAVGRRAAPRSCSGRGRSGPHTAYGFWYVVGNKAVTFVCNPIYNCWLADTMTCQKAMSTEPLRSLACASRGSRSKPRSPLGCWPPAVGSPRCRSPTRARRPRGGKKADPGPTASRWLRTFARCRVR